MNINYLGSMIDMFGNALENKKRKMIYHHILAYPGVSFGIMKKIFDITDNLLIDYREWATELSSDLAFDEATDYTLDLSHQYELQLYAEVFAGDNPQATSSLGVSIVPEPCTLALLGLGGLMLRKRKA